MILIRIKLIFKKKDNNFIFKTDNYEAKIQGLKDDEFPIIPTVKSKESIEISPVVFKKAVSQVISAAHISEIRPEISGVLFDYQVTLLKLVATDSFRLAEKTINEKEFKSTFNHGFKAIIPLKTIQEVVRIFDNDQPINIFIDDNQILFKNDTLEVISRLIDGEYPDYQQIIPKNIETELVVNRDNFSNAIRLVSTFSGKNNDVNLSVKNGKVMEVYLANQLLGENNYLIPTKVSGSDFEGISFNYRYLLDGLKAFDSNELIFGVNNHNKPAVIKSSDDSSHFYILMPIKV
ncbi:MAG: DNA polymerase III subunit beta [Patescibacteria group bacterium]